MKRNLDIDGVFVDVVRITATVERGCLFGVEVEKLGGITLSVHRSRTIEKSKVLPRSEPGVKLYRRRYNRKPHSYLGVLVSLSATAAACPTY